MGTIFNALARALKDLAKPRILAVVLLPMLGAVLLWSVLAWVFWSTWTGTINAFVDGTTLGAWLMTHGAGWVVLSISTMIVIALLLPAVLITAMIITELVAMPLIVSVVSRAYPGMEKRSGGTLVGSIANAFAATSIFVLLWIVTLPLWLTGIGALVLPALISAYFNQRLFRYDALAEHAARDEYHTILRESAAQLYLLGLILASMYYVPFLNLIAPVFSGLAFTHYCMSALARLRDRTMRP